MCQMFWSLVYFYGTRVSILQGMVAARFASGWHKVADHTREVHRVGFLDGQTALFLLRCITSVWILGSFFRTKRFNVLDIQTHTVHIFDLHKHIFIGLGTFIHTARRLPLQALSVARRSGHVGR